MVLGGVNWLNLRRKVENSRGGARRAFPEESDAGFGFQSN